MKHDWSQYIGQEVVIVKELLEDVYAGDPYEPDCVPSWNYVGNVLTITKYNTQTESFGFVDQHGHAEELLLDYDFENGFVELLPETDVQLDTDVISALL